MGWGVRFFRRRQLQESSSAALAASEDRGPGGIPAELLERVKAIEIRARRLVNDLFLGEYIAMIVMASLSATLFLGGPEVPFWPEAPWWAQLAAFCAKLGFFLFLFLWVRWTLPRFRFDQLMRLGWKVMLPLSLANLFVTGVVISLS